MDRLRRLLACAIAACALTLLCVAGASAARHHHKATRHTNHHKRHKHKLHHKRHRHKLHHKRHKHGHKLRRASHRRKRHDTTPPSAPSSLTATAGDGTVSLSWHASTDNVGVTGYRVLRGGSTIATVGGSTLSYTNTGLTNGTTYSYTVRATDAAGNVSADSNTATATPTGTASTPPTSSSHGTLVFDDEFNGTSVDTSKWNGPGEVTAPISPSVSSNCNDGAQLSEGGGELDIHAVASPCTVNGHTYPYRAGRVYTDNKFSFLHGYMEARIWMPPGNGMWGGWWASGPNWPFGGEIDVVEDYGNDNPTFHYHYACDSGGGDCAVGGSSSLPGATSGWHIYAAEWNASTITWYYDGRQVFQTASRTTSPMVLILNLATQGTNVAVPNVMRVDYVRVWQ